MSEMEAGTGAVVDESEGRFGDWCETYSGKPVWIMDLRPGDVETDTLAHALAFKNRFNGHGRLFFSVGVHCLNASYHPMLETAREKAEALLHDAEEYLLPDVARPLKPYLFVQVMLPGGPRVVPFSVYSKMVRRVIFTRYGLATLATPLDELMSPKVKLVDNEALKWEASWLMASKGEGWGGMPKTIDPWWGDGHNFNNLSRPVEDFPLGDFSLRPASIASMYVKRLNELLAQISKEEA